MGKLEPAAGGAAYVYAHKRPFTAGRQVVALCHLSRWPWVKLAMSKLSPQRARRHDHGAEAVHD
jgi:hypothetical protein